MDQKRFLLAIVLSCAIIFGWSILQRRLNPPDANANGNANVAATTTATPEATAQAANNTTANNSNPANGDTAANPAQPKSNDTQPVPDNVPQRTLTIESPLYKVTLDSHGAVATSWILKQNRDTGRPIYSLAGRKEQQIPLELVSPEALKRAPREIPLRVVTDDAAINSLLDWRNYEISGATSDAVNFTSGDQRIEFKLRDTASGLETTKIITFHADSYIADVEVKMTRGGQTVPNTRLFVGSSIGDQGVSHYTFYSVAPQAIAATSNGVERHTAADINSKNSNLLALGGQTEWAGVADTYFAMVAIPATPVAGTKLEVTHKYAHDNNGKNEDRFLVDAQVPVAADGSKNFLFVGPKDHFLLEEATNRLAGFLPGRKVDLDGLIDYGFGATISRPIAVQILKAINFLYSLTGNYGVAIIIFTIFIYSMFFPLKWVSTKKMKKAQVYAPRMKELQEKLKGVKADDPRMKELQAEQIRLMREANPLGGCLPMLLQMPFLFALFRAITISIDFRQSSFLWIPDLSSAEPYPIHILPLLFAGSMLVVQLITPMPTADAQQKMQRNMMAVMMPVMMLWFMWSAPAGLLLYWLVGNIISFIQQFIINKLVGATPGNTPPDAKEDEKFRAAKKIKSPNPAQA